MEVNANVVRSGRTGTWNVSVAGRDVTFYRGAPTSVKNVTFTEPYGPQSATLSFPKISGLEPFGANSSDLKWLRDGALVDIVWTPAGGAERASWVFPALMTHSANEAVRGGADNIAYLGSTTGGEAHRLRWYGKVVSVEASNGNDGTTVQCIGAMHVLDNYLVQPFTALRPTPIEQAIIRSFALANQRHDSKIATPIFIPHQHTAKRFHPGDYANSLDPQTDRQRRKKPYYLKPLGLAKGDLWTGYTTRKLGAWEKTLTEFVDPLLKQLRTAYGTYTLRLYNGNQPILHHRTFELGSDLDGLVIVNLLMPGVDAKFSHDYSMTVTTVYGKTSSTISATEWDGQVYAPDGNSYWYEPFASTPWVDPDRHPNPEAVRREVYDEFQYLQPNEAKMSARRHLAVMGDTGVIADIGINGVDPSIYARLDEGPAQLHKFPRQLITPGMRVRLDGMHGQVPGPVCMVTEASHDADEGSVQFRVDSKFRDHTTVREVRMRNRDALKPTHSLVVPSNFGLNIKDPLIPWSYAKGCGYFPRASHKMWKRWLKDDEGAVLTFPHDWYEMTRRFPPLLRPEYYSKIPAGGDNGRGTLEHLVDPQRFWNTRHRKQKVMRDELLLSQAGTIDLSQMICVDEMGEKVPAVFHFSVWNTRVFPENICKLPMKPDDFPQGVIGEWPDPEHPNKKKYAFHTDGAEGHNKPAERWYKPGRPYPFFKSAFDEVDTLGRKLNSLPRNRMYVGWGSYWEQAGFYPGSSRLGDPATGAFEDASDWEYNQASKTNFNSRDDYKEPAKGDEEIEVQVATAAVLIFCDSHINKDLYFLGRFYKKEQS